MTTHDLTMKPRNQPQRRFAQPPSSSSTTFGYQAPRSTKRHQPSERTAKPSISSYEEGFSASHPPISIPPSSANKSTVGTLLGAGGGGGACFWAEADADAAGAGTETGMVGFLAGNTGFRSSCPAAAAARPTRGIPPAGAIRFVGVTAPVLVLVRRIGCSGGVAV
jgi:hypothetical protein